MHAFFKQISMSLLNFLKSLCSPLYLVEQDEKKRQS